MRTKVVDGVTVALSPAEEAARDAEEATWAASKASRAKDRLALRRYDAEVGGVTVGGAPIATDRESQAKLIAARILAKEDAGYTLNWKTLAGFQSLNSTQIIAVADAVASHVQACFNNEATLSAAIDAAQDPDSVNVDTGWP